jgi:single-strand DNA-binding protein
MSNGITATVVGWIATAPRQVIGPSGVAFTSFRMASTPRYFDRAAATWADGRTEWITVKVFRDAAFNVAASLHKGDPVIVTGRLATSEWESDNGPRTDLVLEATALGPDVTRGTCIFARTVHIGPAAQSVGTDGRTDVEGASGADGRADVEGASGAEGSDAEGASGAEGSDAEGASGAGAKRRLAGTKRRAAGGALDDLDLADELENLGPEDPFADLAATAGAVATP